MLKAYKYRLYPNKEQSVLLNKHFGSCRFIYNWALDMKIKAYQNNKGKISKFDLDKLLTKLKKEEGYEWLKEINSQSLQASNRHLDVAFSNFFQKRNDFPKFKSKKTNRFKFEVPSGIKLDIDNNRVVIPKFKSGIKIILSRTPKGVIRQATVSKTPTGKYYISILCETNETNKSKYKIDKKTTIGIDLGVKDFITTSNGVKYKNNRYLKQLENKLIKEQKKLSKKEKGSSNRKKQRIKVNKIYEKIVNKRLDYIHKLSSKLISENKTIAIEDLNIKGMTARCKPKQDENGKFIPNGQSAKSGLNKSILDVSWGKFIEILKYKAEWYGVNILTIGKFEPSSKMCSCGVINRNLKLSDRKWKCESCGKVHDRDILAAKNIKKFALNANMGSGRPLVPVEDSELSEPMKQEFHEL